MGGPIFFWIICGFMAFIQIEFWLVFPKKLRDLLVANPVLAFILEFVSSLSISFFTGIGSFVGLANVCSGIFFMIWVMYYKNKEGIKGLRVGSHKLLRVPVCPRIIVCYEKTGKTWEL